MKKTAYFLMAGGSGTRLWPMSRAWFPKQLHALLGKESLLERSLRRILKNSNPGNILIGTREELYFSIKEQWAKVSKSFCPFIILEPVSRNTAAAVALSIFACRERFAGDVILVVLPSDHLIEKQKFFAQALKKGMEFAEQGYIISFGIKPTYPETGYGYINLGRRIEKDVFNATAFVEKPKLELAQKFVKSKKYLWNSGIFIFDTAVVATYMKEFCPNIWKTAGQVWRQRKEKAGRVTFDKTSFERFPELSFDYAVMEKAPRQLVIKAGFGWCDAGCWRMIQELFTKDKRGNVFSGDVFALDTTGSFIRAEKRFIAAVGLKDLIIIDTPDALLVCDKERSQEVKKIVARLDRQRLART